MGNCAGALFVIVTGPVRSLAVAMPRLICEEKHCGASTLTVRFVGKGRFGGVVSRMVTGNVFRLVEPSESTATQVTKLVPKGKTEPEGGVHVTAMVGWQRLEAVALKVTVAPLELVASATMPVGQLIA